MSRYIDADKKLTITVYDDEHEENIDRYMTIEEILDTYTSEGCPTIANVVEVVHGEWIDGYKRQSCSVCHYRGMRSWNYCPNCGAKMEVIK